MSGNRREENKFIAQSASEKSAKISGLISQAEEYFNSADISSIATKPLQLYYGVMSLTKAVILSRNEEIDFQDIRYHGLDHRPRTEELKKYSEDPQRWELLEEYANVNNGVFNELQKFMSLNELPNGTTIKLGRVMATDPEIRVAFNRFSGQKSVTFDMY